MLVTPGLHFSGKLKNATMTSFATMKHFGNNDDTIGRVIIKFNRLKGN